MWVGQLPQPPRYFLKRVLFLLIILTTTFSPAFGIPPEITIEAIMVQENQLPLQGFYTITYEIFDSTQTKQFEKTITSLIFDGIVKIQISDQDLLNSSIFYLPSAIQRITVQSVSGELNEQISFPFQSIASAMISERSNKTHRFLNEDLVFISSSNHRIGIASANAEHTLDIHGNVRATTFRGDGSQLNNLDYIRWRTGHKAVYYNDGFVGIGTQVPSASLHVIGTTTNIQSDLNIIGELQSAFDTEGPFIRNLNASNITQGRIKPEQTFGQYPNLLGVGTLVGVNEWQSSIITDAFIANDLTISNSYFYSSMLAGTLRLTRDVLIESDANFFRIHTSNFRFDRHSIVNETILPHQHITNSEIAHMEGYANMDE